MTYAVQSAERLSLEDPAMLVAAAVGFAVHPPQVTCLHGRDRELPPWPPPPALARSW